MKSKIFYSNLRQQIEKKIQRFLNTLPVESRISIEVSPRTVGDAVQELLAKNFGEILGSLCKEYSQSFARRAMADLAFKDNNNIYYIVDVKTHRRESGFHMPNLTSVERLSRFYEDDKNYFLVLMVAYSTGNECIVFDEVKFAPIEFLNWNCLTIGALGWGQIQIRDSNRIILEETPSRRKWMLQFCDRLAQFYPNEIGKINDRMTHFKKVRQFWEQKTDDI